MKIKISKNLVLLAIAVVAVLITAGLIMYKSGSLNFKLPTFEFPSPFGASDKQLAQKVIDYVNKNQLAGPGQTVTLGKVSEESGLVKLEVKIATNTVESYITKDGNLLFPTAIKIVAPKTSDTASQTSSTKPDITKVDKPVLEAYVVADCPYGLQMQRAIAEAIKSVPALADYIKVRYIGSASGNNIFSMHDSNVSGKQVANGLEAEENLKQVCIREQQPEKYWGYVSCYMQKASGALANTMPIGDSKGCSSVAKIDQAKLIPCLSNTGEGLAYIKQDYALDTKYSVQGSPTLILDGVQISEDSFGGRSADGVKNIVCAAFKKQPSFCSQKLNTNAAAASFSLTYASASGSQTNSAACATPAAQ